MTAIVGLVADGDVWIGGDSEILWSPGYGRMTASPGFGKVFRLGLAREHPALDVILGVSGSVRESQLVRHRLPMRLKLPTLGRSLAEWMTVDFMDALREVYGSGGFKKTADGGVESAPFAAMLVGIAGRLFSVYTDFSWCENPEGLDAVGCGGPAARGALRALRERRGGSEPPEHLLTEALRIAALDNAGVRAPFVVERLGWARAEVVAA